MVAALVALFLGLVTSVSAHGGGPEYLMIGGEYAPANPILSYAEPATIAMGEDVAAHPGYVGEAIPFAVDLERFPSEEGAVLPQFRWDFADGTEPVVGARVSHVYQKPGTYIVTLQVDSQDADTIQIDVLPKEGYEKVQPTISVDGKLVENPTVDIITIQPSKKVIFRAQASGSAQYQWDFGNDKGAQGETAETRYARDEYFPVVVLRAIDENGLWSDTYALLDLPPPPANPILRLWYTIVDFITSLTAR